MTEFEQMILDAIKEVKQGIDGIHKKIDGHTDKLSCHETDIELLKKDFQHHTEHGGSARYFGSRWPRQQGPAARPSDRLLPCGSGVRRGQALMANAAFLSALTVFLLVGWIAGELPRHMCQDNRP